MHTHIDAKHMKLIALRHIAGVNQINKIERYISDKAEKGDFHLFISDSNIDLYRVIDTLNISAAEQYFNLKGYYFGYDAREKSLYIQWK